MSFIVKAATGSAVVSRQKGHQPSVMSSRFPDVEFQSAWRELDKPQLEGGWEHFVEAMGVTIFRLFDKGSQLYEYKVFGVLATSTQLCADVYMDLAYRKHWDKYVKELYEKDFSGQSAIYWEVKYPFPLSNRDYVYVRERRDLDVDGRKISVILARSAPEVPCPEVSGVLRVKDYKQSVAMESDGGSGTKIFLNYFDNPGGSIPSWLVNWAAGTGVPGFLTEMQKACSNYSSYCEKK